MENQNHGLGSLRANNEGELYEPRTVLATWRYPMDSESCMRVLLVQSFIFVERVIAYTLLVPSNAMGAHQRPRAPRTGLTYKVRTKLPKLTKRRSGQLPQIQMQNMRARPHMQPLRNKAGGEARE